MKTNLFLLSSLIATGCSGGVSEDEFGEEAAKVFCAKMFECLDGKTLDFMGYDDEDACVEDLETEMEPGGDDDDCEYDAGAADDCLDAFEEMSCEDLKDPNAQPSECEDVCPEE